MSGEVLLFNKCAAAHLAARVHSDSCPLVAAAKRSHGKVAVIIDELKDNVDDLNERGFRVVRCKCLGGE